MKTEPTIEQVVPRLPADAYSIYISDAFTYGQIRLGNVTLWWPRGNRLFEIEMHGANLGAPSRGTLSEVIEVAERRLQDAQNAITKTRESLASLRAAAFPTTQDEDDAC